MIVRDLIFLLIAAGKTIFGQTIDLNTFDQVYYLKPGVNLTFSPISDRFIYTSSDFRIFCYLGSEKIITNYFQTTYLQLDIDNDDFVQYDGYSPEEVKEHYEENKSIFSFSFFSYKKTRLKLNPFNQTCIGIETRQPYKIQLNLVRIDIVKIFLLIIGVVIFFYASKLSTNSIFYYASGIGLGISASLLILIYLTGKLFPSKTMMYGVLIGGSTIAYYMLHLIFDNIQLILVTYHTYLLWYIIITGFISFVICYRLGPPKNKRSKDLIKWSLQLAAIISIYASSQLNEATYLIIIAILIIYHFPKELFGKIRKMYRKWCPPTKRLLTMEEFEAEGIIETKKALKELREYCSSPECKSWKMMTKLKNPKRFASFVDGENHVWEDEVFDYENSRDDVDDDSDNDAENVYEESTDEDQIENEDVSEDDDNLGKKASTPRRFSSSRERSSINSPSNSSHYRLGFERHTLNNDHRSINSKRDSIKKLNNGQNHLSYPYNIGWNNVLNSSVSRKNHYELSDDE